MDPSARSILPGQAAPASSFQPNHTNPTGGCGLRLALGTPLYQAVLAFAALRAVVRQVVDEISWEKTSHFGLHYEGTDAGNSLAPGAGDRVS
jgi:hypothetical protein